MCAISEFYQDHVDRKFRQPSPAGAAESPGVAAVLPTGEQMQALADQLKTLVKADKTLVNLSPGASDQITLTNTSAGW